MVTLIESLTGLGKSPTSQSIRRERMSNYDLTKQAFENAIKSVGMTDFKMTSMFLKNNGVSTEQQTESYAA